MKCRDCPVPAEPGRQRCLGCLNQQNEARKKVRKFIPLERTTEAAVCKALTRHRFDHEKWGRTGKPDRLIHLWRTHYVWFEFKREKLGGLTPAQKRRIPKMRARGELVFIVTGVEDSVRLALELRSQAQRQLALSPPEWYVDAA